jgi:ankyrin repeat protein
MRSVDLDLKTALGRGDPEEVAALIAAGADVHFRDEHGYGALLAAVHDRDVPRDPRLLDLLRLLVANGVDLNGISSYKESGLRVLSHIGRFDGVRVLLEAGADRSQLQWTPLIEAVALGTLADVERLASDGANLEAREWWGRTAWLMALVAGDLAKATRLRDLGADTSARGRCAFPPLSYAVEAHHPEVVRWLLEIGQDVDQKDEFESTPLLCAVEGRDVECASLLIAAGADVDHDTPGGSVLSRADRREIAQLLLDAGADPRRLSQEGQRALCGLGDVQTELAGVAEEDFRRAPQRRFGRSNPERMLEPFWEAMIRAGVSGYIAGRAFDPSSPHAASPIWCAMRFGQSITRLPDGRVVQIAGEHEDHYDPDFCIYNDAFVHHADGAIAVYGYPAEVFPPTDFHTATLVDGGIYVIGSLGYHGSRRYGETPVYRLDLETFAMERVETSGDAPGWIYGHRAVRATPGEVRVTGGTIVTGSGTGEDHSDNLDTFVLDLADRSWRRNR